MTKNSYSLDEVRRRIESGEQSWAIERLRSLIGAGHVGPDVHRLLAWAYLKDKAPQAAITALQDARALTTTSATELAFGRFLNEEGYKDAALNCFFAATELNPENPDACALVCMLYVELGQLDLAVPFGQRSLEIRDRQSRGQAFDAVTLPRPSAFDPSSPNKNIISFSLFGENPYYWESAIAIASMAFAIFPEWRCRFYCDPRVPEDVRHTLLRLRSQLFVLSRQSVNWSGLFWRFYAFDDPDVNVVMVRDVDSPFTLRERLAVEEWLASDLPFHVIRDHLGHSEPIMAGLWGGWTGLLPNMGSLVESHLDQARNRYADQEFLRRQIWPRIRSSTLAHDRHFRLGETRRFAHHPTEAYTHIGMGWPRQARNVSPVPLEAHTAPKSTERLIIKGQ